MLSFWLRPTKPHTASAPSSTAASNTPQHEVMLLLADGRVVVEHVVEVARGPRCRPSTPSSRQRRALARALSKGLRRSSVLATGSSIASGGTSDSARVQRRRKLDVVGADLAGENEPIFDGLVGVLVAHVARRELLKGGGQDSESS